MKTKNKYLKIVGMDSTKNVLFNFSSKFFLFFANLFFLPVALITAYDLGGRLPFVGMFFAICVVSTVWWAQGMEPFTGGGARWWGPKEFSQLDESALRVLTFFRSRKAKELIFRVTLVYLFVILITWFLSMNYADSFNITRSLGLHDPSGARIEFTTVVTTAFGLCVHATLMVIILGYALKHYDEIQKNYDPWPRDKAYHFSITFNKKRKKS